MLKTQSKLPFLLQNYFSFFNYLMTLNKKKLYFQLNKEYFYFVYYRYENLLKNNVFFKNELRFHLYPDTKNRYFHLNPQTRVLISDVNDEIDFKNHSFSRFTNKYKFVKQNLLNIFFFFNYSYFGSQFTAKNNYMSFCVTTKKNNLMIFDLNKFFFRWNDAYNLIFNIYYYDLNPIILGSPLFKNEILSLNWHHSSFDINLWRYYFPFFIFKTNKYSSKTSFFFERLELFDVNSFIVTDCHYHYKNLFYLKKKKFYSIGLVDVYTNPWILDYPILSFFEGSFSQLFFFKLLIFIERQVLFFKYSFFKNYWYKFLNSNNFMLLNK